MEALGRHLLLDLKECNGGLLNDVSYLRALLLEAANACGGTVLGAFSTFNPYGVSGVVLIAESHLSIHTWPEFGFAAVDIFTCGNNIIPELAVKVIVGKLNSTNQNSFMVERGLSI